MKISFTIYDLMPDIEIQIACHPFYGNDSYRVISTLFKSIQKLSADNLEIGSNEVTMLCSRFGKVTKIKAVVDKDDNRFSYKMLEDGGFYCEEETQPIDTLMVELLEKSSLKIQDVIDNQHGMLYLECLTAVICEFYRLTFDPRLIQNKHKVLIDRKAKIEASILHKTWLAIQKIACLDNEAHLQDEIVEVFRRLIFCGELLMPARSKNANQIWTKTKIVKRIQSENKLLNARGDLGIPFTEDSYSHLFIKHVMDWANNNPDFHKHYYKPLIEARMQLPGYLFDGNNNIKLVGKDIKPELRGRPRGKKKAEKHS
jgi:hypothetical protein